MSPVNAETCRQYLARHLAGGWRFAPLRGSEYLGILSSPGGESRRLFDLRNDVETLRPSATGDESNNTVYPSGAAYAAVDEATSDGDATYIKGGDQWPYETWRRDFFNLPAHSLGAGTINGITVYAVCRAFSANINHASLKICIKSGAGDEAPDTATEGTEQTMSGTSYAIYSQEWATNPATGSAWTWDEIDQLQIGISLRNTYGTTNYVMRCTQVWVEVSYVSATAKTSDDSGAGSDSRAGDSPLASLIPTDGGSGTESLPVISAAIADDDSGGELEAVLNLSGKLSSESGSGSEAGYAEILAIARDSADSGAGAEAASAPQVALSRNEAGSAIESLAARLMVSGDSLSASEAANLAATTRMLTAADSGAGIETLAGFLAESIERGYGADKRAAIIMAFTGSADLRLRPDKGKIRLPTKGVNP